MDRPYVLALVEGKKLTSKSRCKAAISQMLSKRLAQLFLPVRLRLGLRHRPYNCSLRCQINTGGRHLCLLAVSQNHLVFIKEDEAFHQLSVQ